MDNSKQVSIPEDVKKDVEIAVKTPTKEFEKKAPWEKDKE